MTMFINPIARATVGGMPTYRGWQVAPPLAWHTVAMAFHAGSNATHNGGLKKDGTVRGNGKPFIQDTYLNGPDHIVLPGYTYLGQEWVSRTGIWRDDLVAQGNNKTGLISHDGGVTVERRVSQYALAVLVNHQLDIGRGNPPPSNTLGEYSAANYYTKVRWDIRESLRYQFVAEYGRPARLEVSVDGGYVYKIVHTLTTTIHAEDNPAASFRLRVNIDKVKGVFEVAVVHEGTLRHAPENRKAFEGMTPGEITIFVKNGWASVQYFPLAYEAVTVSSAPIKVPGGVNGREARVVVNALNGGNSSQNHTTGYTTDGRAVSYNATASIPGGSSPPVFSDATLVLPAVWSNNVDGRPDYRFAQLPLCEVVEQHVFDPTARVRTSGAMLTCHNHDLSLKEFVGNLACDVDLSNGGQFVRRITGISRNPTFLSSGYNVKTRFSVTDHSLILMEPIGQEVVLDGWEYGSVVRYICEVCGLHPRWIAPQLPLYIPPGATADAPYGPASYDCPYPTLPRGTGLNARHKYLPSQSGWSILQELVADRAVYNPMTLGWDAFWMGFDPIGLFHFEPYRALFEPIKRVYSDKDASGQGQCIGQIEWSVSTDDLRTHIHLQGIDAFTNELLVAHREMAPWVKALSGFPRKMIERSPRFTSEEQMEGVLNGMTFPASLPDLTGHFTAPFHPDVFPMDVVRVYDFRQQMFLDCVVESLTSTVASYENGHQEGTSEFHVRSRENYR